MTDDLKPLSEKHLKFVDQYLTCWNATAAYMVVYPSSKYTAARSSSADLLTKPNIQAEITRRLKEQAMDTAEVLARLTDYARGSIRPFMKMDEQGKLFFDFSNPEAQEHLHLIKKTKTKRSRRVDGTGDNAEVWEDEWTEVELHDPQRALELLGRANKMFITRHEITGKDGAPLGPQAVDLKTLGKFMSDDELDKIQEAADILERAQRAHDASVKTGD